MKKLGRLILRCLAAVFGVANVVAITILAVDVRIGSDPSFVTIISGVLLFSSVVSAIMLLKSILAYHDEFDFMHDFDCVALGMLVPGTLCLVIGILVILSEGVPLL